MKVNDSLIKDCLAGNRKAQFSLHKTCYSILMSVCLRYKVDKEETKASVNAGFLKILNNLNRYNPEIPFDAWIRRIMINHVIDEFRKNRKVQELIEYTDFDEKQIPSLVDYNEADKAFDASDLEAMIKNLPPVTQKVFNLFAIDGYSHQEISKMLGMSEGTSKWHVNSARKKLQETINQKMNSQKVI